jgi:predicted metal-dependent peptidase
MSTATNDDMITGFRMKAREFYPYLSGYLYQLDPHERPGLGTMAVDKNGRMYYDPEFASRLTVEEGGYVVTHEGLHLILRHCHRSVDIIGEHPTSRERRRLNIAYDLVIWEMLEAIAEHAPKFDDGSEPVTWDNMSKAYPKLRRNMSPEEIYKIMLDQDEEEEKKQPPPPPPPPPEEEEDDDYEPPVGGDQPSDDDGEGDDEGDDGEPGEEKSNDDGEPGEQDSKGDGDPQDDDGDEKESGGQGDGDEADGDEEQEGDGRGHGDASDRFGDVKGSSSSDNQPREYEEAANENWESFQERKLLEQLEEKIKEAPRDWQNSRGTTGLVNGVLCAIEKKLRPQPDPWSMLRAAVSMAVKSNRGTPVGTWMRTNRRQYAHPKAPRMKGNQPFSPKAVVIIDSSGSMTSECKVKAFNVVAQGLKAVGEFVCIVGDVAVQSEVRLNSLAKFEFPQGGGTDMRPLIKHAEDEYAPDVIVLVTDGGTLWPNKKTKAQMIVALTQELPTPEWATRCRIPDEGKQR